MPPRRGGRDTASPGPGALSYPDHHPRTRKRDDMAKKKKWEPRTVEELVLSLLREEVKKLKLGTTTKVDDIKHVGITQKLYITKDRVIGQNGAIKMSMYFHIW